MADDEIQLTQEGNTQQPSLLEDRDPQEDQDRLPLPEKVVLRKLHEVSDPKALTEVLGLKTVLAFAANQNIQIIKSVNGKKQRVPSAAISDLIRFGAIARPPNFKE